jgi:mycothiol system anti-sigma-R factor
MSCGNPHEVDCGDVLDRVYVYLDGEIDHADLAKIRQHLDECAPCFREVGLEQAVRALIHKHCGHDPVPDDLRTKVLMRIQEVRSGLG